MRVARERLADRLPARVVAVVAAILLLGGGGAATAARVIGGEDIKKRAISPVHIDSETVRGRHVDRRAIRRRHLAPNARPGRGPPGPPGIGELAYPFAVAEVGPGEGTEGREGVSCPDGRFPTGGSIAAFDPETDAMIPGVVTGSQAGFIDDDGIPHGWSGEWENATADPVRVVIEVICAPAEVVSGPSLGDPPAPVPDRSGR